MAIPKKGDSNIDKPSALQRIAAEVSHALLKRGWDVGFVSLSAEAERQNTSSVEQKVSTPENPGTKNERVG